MCVYKKLQVFFVTLFEPLDYFLCVFLFPYLETKEGGRMLSEEGLTSSWELELQSNGEIIIGCQRIRVVVYELFLPPKNTLMTWSWRKHFRKSGIAIWSAGVFLAERNYWTPEYHLLKTLTQTVLSEDRIAQFDRCRFALFAYLSNTVCTGNETGSLGCSDKKVVIRHTVSTELFGCLYMA